MEKNIETKFALPRQTGNIKDTKYWKLHLLNETTEVSLIEKEEDHATISATGASLIEEEANHAAITAAAALLREGGTVAFPTETVYGLGADARNTAAVEAVFAAKGRPSDNPLIVHIADQKALDELVEEVHPTATALMEAFWPGPLTLVLPVRPGVLSPRVTAGLDTVGIRIPSHPVALSLLREAGCPVAAPSANRSGRPSPTLASHVMEDLSGFIDAVVDGGAAGVGLESTVVQVLPEGTVAVLRPGGITAEQLAAVAGAGAVDTAPAHAAETAAAPAVSAAGLPAGDSAGEDNGPAPRAPGMKYTHYAPRGWLGVVRGSSPQAVAKTAAELLQAAQTDGGITGLLRFEEHAAFYPASPAACVVSLGSIHSPEEGARSLYAALRRFDEAGATYILAEACPETGLGAAIMNRLMKAAGGTVIAVE